MPCALADARPLALRPPASDLPSFRCHAGDLAIVRHSSGAGPTGHRQTFFSKDAFAGDDDVDGPHSSRCRKREQRDTDPVRC